MNSIELNFNALIANVALYFATSVFIDSPPAQMFAISTVMSAVLSFVNKRRIRRMQWELSRGKTNRVWVGVGTAFVSGAVIPVAAHYLLVTHHLGYSGWEGFILAVVWTKLIGRTLADD